MSANDVVAVVPVKDTRTAKQRLSPVLDQKRRTLLARAMLEDVLVALRGATRLAGLVAVTADPVAAELTRGYGGRVMFGGGEDGQTAAMRYAMRALAAEGCRALLTLPIDIPLVTPQEIDAVIAASVRDPDFVIVPAHDREGSNAILCRPPECVPLSFGNHSFAPHLETARQHGVEPLILELPGIGLDIDNPADLEAFLAISSSTRTHALLDSYSDRDKVRKP